MGHEGKCKNIHGHNYKAEVTATGLIDKIGRVVDFSVLKEKVGRFIDESWDHAILLNCLDTKLHKQMLLFRTESGEKQKIYCFSAANPTAEVMAAFLLEKANALMFGHGIIINQVRIWETENSYAEAVWNN